MDAAGLPPDARIASYSRVAAAIHFANNVLVGYNSPSPISAPAGRTEGAQPQVEQVAAAVAERAVLVTEEQSRDSGGEYAGGARSGGEDGRGGAGG